MSDTNVIAEVVTPAATVVNDVKTEVVKEAKVEAPEVTVEAAVEEVPKVEEKPTKSASKLAAIKAREAEIERKRIEIETKAREIEQKEQVLSREAILKNPSAALKAAGITFEDLTNAILSEGDPKPEDKGDVALREIEALKEEQRLEKERKQKELEEAEQSRIDRVVEDFKGRIAQAVDSEPDKFELVKANEAYGLVYDVVRAYFDKHGKILAPEDAATLVEDHLWKKAQKLLEAKKIKQVVSQQPDKKATAKTLSNGVTNSPAAQVVSSGKLSDTERLKRAAQHLRFN